MKKNTIKNYMGQLTNKVTLIEERKRILIFKGDNIRLTIHYIADGIYTVYGYIREKIIDIVSIRGVKEVQKTLNNLYWNM